MANNNEGQATGNALLVIFIVLLTGFGVYYFMTQSQEESNDAGVEINLPTGNGSDG